MPKPTPPALAALSVQERAEQGFEEESPLVFWIAHAADEIGDWWTRSRDIDLDRFWKTETFLCGAVFSMCAKIAALSFKLKGPPKTRKRYLWTLKSADYGAGWVSFIPKWGQDIFTQDNGAFMELLRKDNTDPRNPVVGIAHLDSQRCRRTGNAETPVGYTKKTKGAEEIPLKWWQVIAMSDLPSPREEYFGVGFCAVSRVLHAAQILRDIGIYKRQKLGGKRIPALLFVQGMRRNAVRKAVQMAKEEQLSQGETLYTSPVIVASPDPSRMGLEAKLIELAGLPDHYDEDVTMKWYIAQLATAFGTDYTEFAPLPGGGLGTATQSTEMAARARGKGPGVTLQMLEFNMNWYVLPESLLFEFASTDPLAEQERINLSWMRARERRLRVQSGEITGRQALRLAVEEGDAPSSFLVEQEEELEQLDEIAKGLVEMKSAMLEAESLYRLRFNERPLLINGETGKILNR